MSWLSLGDLEEVAEAVPPRQKTPLEAMVSSRARARTIRERMEALRGRRAPSEFDLPAPAPPVAPGVVESVAPPEPAPAGRIYNGDIWKMVAIGTASALLVSLIQGRRKR